MVAEHPVLGFAGDVHLVFVPGDFGLGGRYLRSALVADSAFETDHKSSWRTCGERPRHTDLWRASDGAAEGGVVSCYNGAVNQGTRELGSLGQVVLFVCWRLVHAA